MLGTASAVNMDLNAILAAKGINLSPPQAKAGAAKAGRSPLSPLSNINHSKRVGTVSAVNMDPESVLNSVLAAQGINLSAPPAKAGAAKALSPPSNIDHSKRDAVKEDVLPMDADCLHENVESVVKKLLNSSEHGASSVGGLDRFKRHFLLTADRKTFQENMDKLLTLARHKLSEDINLFQGEIADASIESPLEEVYKQAGESCWVEVGASVLHAKFNEWFGGMGLRQLFPFAMIEKARSSQYYSSDDATIHKILVKVGAFDDLAEGANLYVFAYRISPFLGALLALYGPPEHQALAEHWMDGGLVEQVVGVLNQSGEDLTQRITSLQDSGIHFPFSLGVNQPMFGHALILLNAAGGAGLAKNSWGKGEWKQSVQEPDELVWYEKNRLDPESDMLTVDFSNPLVKDWSVLTFSEPGRSLTDEDMDGIRTTFVGMPREMMGYMQNCKNEAIFPDGINTVPESGIFAGKTAQYVAQTDLNGTALVKELHAQGGEYSKYTRCVEVCFDGESVSDIINRHMREK